MKQNIFIVVLLLIIVLLLFRECGQKFDSKNQRLSIDLIESLNDSLKSARNKNNQQISHISVLEDVRESLLDSISFKDSTINWLLSVKKEQGKATTITVINTITKYDTVSKTEISNVFDTVIIDSVVYLYPTYKTSWNDKWSFGFIEADKDSIRRQFSIINEYEIWQQYEKKNNKLFSGKKLVVYIKNNNPLTSTSELRSWNVSQKKKHFSFGVGFGIGYGFSVPELQPNFYIGAQIQLQYKIFEF